MGRKRTVHLNMPPGMRPRVRASGTYYYYDTGAKEIPLGRDYVVAVQRWAELEGGNAKLKAAEVVTFRAVAEAYMTSPTFKRKAPRTQKDNHGELRQLYTYFDDPPAPLDAIKPALVAKYRDWRESTHSTQELALLSAIWNWSREQGYTDKANPTVGVRRNRGEGRDVFVTDAMFSQVYLWADQPTKDAMDLAHLVGQRTADLVKMTERDIREGAVWIQQNKTGARVRVAIEGRLKAVLERIATRKASMKVHSLALLVNERGQPLTASALDGRFGTARECAGYKPVEFQFRDLRAKAATEVDTELGLEAAQNLLGHAGPGMTRRYIRHRTGKLVKPAK